MSLLPRTAEEFSSAEYWERFFKKRGEKAFEWYGDYNKLCGMLHKYIKPRDKVSRYTDNLTCRKMPPKIVPPPQSICLLLNFFLLKSHVRLVLYDARKNSYPNDRVL